MNYFKINATNNLILKKITLLFYLGLVFMSCKKNYICTCTERATTQAYMFNGTIVEEVTNTTITKDFRLLSKSDAKSWCESKESTEILNDSGTIGISYPQTTITTFCDLEN